MTEGSAPAPFAAVQAVLGTYFDGLYHGDTDRLRRVFHPQAQYVCATAGAQLCLDREAYLDVVENRPAPAGSGARRTDRIVSVEFAGPDLARARVNCSVGDRYFTDFLTLLRQNEEWQIIAKVFHFDPIPDATMEAD